MGSLCGKVNTKVGTSVENAKFWGLIFGVGFGYYLFLKTKLKEPLVDCIKLKLVYFLFLWCNLSKTSIIWSEK